MLISRQKRLSRFRKAGAMHENSRLPARTFSVRSDERNLLKECDKAGGKTRGRKLNVF